MKKKLFLTAALFASCFSWAQAPKADLIDLVFNADGTATDVSPLANPVEVIGTPRIVASTQYGMNVFCAKDNAWGQNPLAAFRIPASEQIIAGMQDGLSIELLVRLNSKTGDIPTEWANAFGYEQTGGTGMLVDGGTWRLETRAGGSYHQAIWKQTPPLDVWTHLVGIWNQEEGKAYLYVNGEKVGETDAEGEYNTPNAQYLFVGCDATSSEKGEHSLPGDYAIYRLYDKPLSAEEVAAAYAEVKAKDTGVEEHDDNLSYEVDEQGNMLISTGEDLFNFGQLIKSGKRLNAKLVNDIDYTAYNSSLSTDANRFRGVFDGQGHTIKVDLNPQYADAGLFDVLESGAFILNLHVDGKMAATSDWTGVLVGDDYGATIQDVLITVDMTTTDDDNTMAGLLAGYNNGKPLYKNVVCIGSINSETATACCGIVADIKGNCTMENCVAIVDIKNAFRDQCTPIYARIRGSLSCKNVSYVNVNQEEYPDLVEGISEIPMEDVLSGKVAAMLGGGNMASVWRQTLGVDETPNMLPDHGIVIQVGSEYFGITENNVKETCEQLLQAANAYAEEVRANQSLIDAYVKAAEQLATSDTRTDFIAYYPTMVEAKAAIEKNVKGYEDFKQTVAEALAQLGEMESNFALQLKDYLTEYMDPSDDLPQGSANYIIEGMTLDNEGLAEQTNYISDMLKKVMAADAEPGTEITVMLANAAMGQSAAGWKGTKPNKSMDNPAALQYYGTKTATLSQTMTGLKNGIYEFDMNALYDVADNVDNPLTNAVIFANANEVPVMSVAAGALPFEEAEDSVNCLITEPDTYPYDKIWDEMYYVPNSFVGGAYALNGGRYLNRILVNVTDGKLMVGVRMDGSGSTKDWLMVSNARLFFRGTMDEAAQDIQAVLEGEVARAQTLVDFEARTSTEEYPYFPNYAASTRAALQAAIAQAAADASAEQKYALIQTFTELFQQAYTERNAYKILADQLEEYYGAVKDYPEMAATIEANYSETWGDWIDGKYNAEEALAKGKELLEQFDNVVADVPAADLLDVVFNADGTATDKSAAANEIKVVGEPRVAKSAEFGLNVFCAATNEWASKPSNYYYTTMSDEMWAGISDGVTYEVLVRPYWLGDYNSTWISVLGYEQGGGIGLITDGGKWCLEAHVGGGYKEAYGSVPVQNEWIHLVGVLNQQDGTISFYENGRPQATVGASGELKRPNISVPNLMIGCDNNGSGIGENAFQGDIAIVRIYNEPLTAPQVNKLWKDISAQRNDGAIEHDESDPNAISTITSAPVSQTIYNLMGQKLSKAQRGINIINGKKQIVK